MIGFFGLPESDKQNAFQNFLRNLAHDTSYPWFIFGDLNDMLSNDDKIGLLDHPSWIIRGFKEATIDCNLQDLPMEGYQYT